MLRTAASHGNIDIITQQMSLRLPRLFSTSTTTATMEYKHILTSIHSNPKPNGLAVGLITLNQPKTLNALSDALFEDLIHACRAFDQNDQIGAMVLTGKGKAFAAGASITEMSQQTFSQAYKGNMFQQWNEIHTDICKPIIAAVNGFALGGGCELAMMCDIVIASENAKFGQPEINLGIIPGAGGTQRLVRAVGKSKAMEMILTGGMIDANKAERDGLISKVVEQDKVVEQALEVGYVIGEKGQVAVRMAKECVKAADEMCLQQGLNFERRLFHGLFATKDQKEGMDAFLNKRQPDFKHE